MNGGTAVLCRACGTELDHPGQGHICRSKDAPPPEPTDLAVASRRLVAFTAAFATSSVIVTILAAVLTAAGVPGPSESPGPRALLLISYFLPAALDAGITTKLIVQVALRLAGAVLLILGVRHTRAWLRSRADPGGEPYEARLYSLTTGGRPPSPLSPTPSGDDWDASVWDPDVLRDIDRRRRPED